MKGLLRVITNGTDEIGELTKQIAAERKKAAEACAEVERLEAARRTADTYEQAQATDEAIARAKWVVERTDAILPELEVRHRRSARSIRRHSAARAMPRRRNDDLFAQK